MFCIPLASACGFCLHASTVLVAAPLLFRHEGCGQRLGALIKRRRPLHTCQQMLARRRHLPTAADVAISAHPSSRDTVQSNVVVLHGSSRAICRLCARFACAIQVPVCDNFHGTSPLGHTMGACVAWSPPCTAANGPAWWWMSQPQARLGAISCIHRLHGVPCAPIGWQVLLCAQPARTRAGLGCSLVCSMLFSSTLWGFWWGFCAVWPACSAMVQAALLRRQAAVGALLCEMHARLVCALLQWIPMVFCWDGLVLRWGVLLPQCGRRGPAAWSWGLITCSICVQVKPRPCMMVLCPLSGSFCCLVA